MVVSTYEEMPYSTFALRSGHLSRLAALARLYGVEVAFPDACSVLEIGCGTGGNIIHLAELYPHSRFVGIDASHRHITQARSFARESEISNIEFTCADIREGAVEQGGFDYIICHGVYSWVSPEVQQHLRKVIANALRAQGIAFVSYNVLPGWRQRGVMRDIMRVGARRAHVGTSTPSPADELEAAIELARLVSAARKKGDDLYGNLVRENLSRMDGADPAYLFHEYLEEFNDPALFSQFMKDAQSVGLQFLSEAKPSLMCSDDLDAQARTYLAKVESDIIAHEQCLDIFRNRAFRETILCRDAHVLKRDLRASVFKSLFFTTDYRKLREADAEQVIFKEVTTGRELSTPNDEHSALLAFIGDTGYAGSSFDELSEKMGSTTDERVLMHTLVRLWRLGFVDAMVSRGPVTLSRESTARISKVARYQLKHGEKLVTALQHRSFKLSEEERAILSFVDGQRSIDQVGEAAHAQRGGVDKREAVNRLIDLGFFSV